MSSAKHWLFSLFIVYPMVSLGLAELSETYVCPSSYWSLLDASIPDFKERVLCYTYVNNMTFEDALTYCHLQQARVFSLNDPSSVYLTPSGHQFLDFLASNGVENIWHGYYVKDERLREDTFPMAETRKNDYENTVFNVIPWNRIGTESEPRGTSECFEIAINLTAPANCFPSEGPPPSGGNQGLATTGLAKRSADFDFKPEDLSRPEMRPKNRRKRQTDFPFLEGGQFCSHQRVAVKSRRCEDSLPFVCVKPALEKGAVSLDQSVMLCQPNDYGNYKLSRCISYGEEQVDYATARVRCRNKGAVDKRLPSTLYRALNHTSLSYLNRLVADAIIESDKLPSPLPAMAWVEGNSETDRCLALILDSSDPGTTVSWDCSASLPFYICQRSVDYPGPSELVAEMSDVPDLEVTNIPGSDDREALVPFAFTVPGGDVVPVLSCVYKSPLLPELHSMTLVKQGFPMLQFKSPGELNVLNNRIANDADQNALPRISMELKNGVSFEFETQTILNNMTDYYWCEINDLRTGKIYQSGRIFVRAKETEVYAASIAASPTFPDRTQLLLNSLSGKDYFNVKRILDLALASPNSSYQYRVLRFRPELSPRESNRTLIDFHFYNQDVGRTRFRASNKTLLAAAATIRSHFRPGPGDTSFNFHLDSLRVKSIDICPNTSVYDPVSDKTYTIMDTKLGEVYSSPEICLSNGLPYVTLKCDGDKLYGATWSEFQPNQGCNFTDAVQSPTTDTLRNISKAEISDETIDDVVTKTTDVVANISTLTPVDIVYVADILQQATLIDNITVENGKKLLELVDAVTEVNDTTLEDSNTLGNATNRIIKSIDELGDNLVLDDVANVRLVTNTTALEVWDVTKVTGDIIVGLKLQSDGGDPVPVPRNQDLISLFESQDPIFPKTDAAILLPGEFVHRIKDENAGKDVRLSMNVFVQTTLFSQGQLETKGNLTGNKVLNSKVVSAKITVDGKPVSDLDSNVVTTVYLPIVKLPSEIRKENSTCVFWNFLGAKGQGAWSKEGCRYDKTLQGRDVCVCDHLTNFAVLLDVYGQSALPQEHQFALSIITIIGLSLSIAGLSITALSFLFIKKLRQGKPQQTLFNMALAMLASWIIFLAGFTRVESHTGCIAVAALLHYFILASFMWMLMEGILQYLLFVKVLGNDFDNYMIKTALPAWGLPLIPVVVVLAYDTELYRGGDQYCWMSLTPFYYAFLAPVALVMLVNIIVYIMVVVNICRRGGKVVSTVNKRAVGIRASIACFIVLGLSWVFAFFAIEDARVVFQYLFTITSSLQGLLIFLIFTARDPTVRTFWKELFCRKKRPDKSTQDKTRTRPSQDQRSEEMVLNRSNQSNSSSENQMHTRRTHHSPANSSESGHGFVNNAFR